jgi:hypothetical protein
MMHGEFRLRKHAIKSYADSQMRKIRKRCPEAADTQYGKFIQLAWPHLQTREDGFGFFPENDKCGSKTWRHMVIFPTERPAVLKLQMYRSGA